jgi:hypothetical protein
MAMTRPTFLKSLLDSWQLSLSQGRERDLLPYWILLSGTVGGVVAYYLPIKFWNGERLDVAVSGLSGLLTFNGIVLALCWSAFGKVYEIVGAGAFCAHLRKHNLLSHYLVFVSYCHATQVIAISCTGFALFALWLPFEIWALKLFVGASFATTIYAVRQGIATSEVMQDLIWQKSEFDAGQPVAPVKAVNA